MVRSSTGSRCWKKPQSVVSVRNALNLLGEREPVRWIRMATAVGIGQNKSSDLVPREEAQFVPVFCGRDFEAAMRWAHEITRAAFSPEPR
jgi:hypothetical protein